MPVLLCVGMEGALSVCPSSQLDKVRTVACSRTSVPNTSGYF